MKKTIKMATHKMQTPEDKSNKECKEIQGMVNEVVRRLLAFRHRSTMTKLEDVGMYIPLALDNAEITQLWLNKAVQALEKYCGN